MGSLLVCHPLIASHPKTASSRPRRRKKRRLKVGHNQLVNSLAEECEKLFALDEICAELSAFSTRAAALIADGGVDRKRPQPI
jgi:hypothetical protein